MFVPANGEPTRTAHNVTMTDNLPRTFIAQHRRAAGLTQEQLAERADVSRSYLAQAEARPINVTLAFLAAIADGLDMPITQLFARPGDDTDKSELLETLEKLSPTASRSLLGVAKVLADGDTDTPFEPEPSQRRSGST